MEPILLVPKRSSFGRLKSVDEHRIKSKMSQNGIFWKINPPATPHQGGAWERLVQSSKRLFYKILGNRRLTDEVLSTVFCLVEQFLNARPLVPASSDVTDLEALTPNHFLLGEVTSLPSFESCKRIRSARSSTSIQASHCVRRFDMATVVVRIHSDSEYASKVELSKSRAEYWRFSLDIRYNQPA